MWKTALAQLDVRPMLRSDLAALWLKEAQAPPGIADVTQMLHLLKAKLITCEGLEVSQALALIEKLVTWLTRAPAESAPGALVSSSEAQADVLTLYTDTAPIMEWPALARVAGRWTFAFGKDLVFLPPPDLDGDVSASSPAVHPNATGLAGRST
jgi:hypothetical protein